jgi:hypothetical protein
LCFDDLAAGHPALTVGLPAQRAGAQRLCALALFGHAGVT